MKLPSRKWWNYSTAKGKRELQPSAGICVSSRYYSTAKGKRELQLSDAAIVKKYYYSTAKLQRNTHRSDNGYYYADFNAAERW